MFCSFVLFFFFCVYRQCRRNVTFFFFGLPPIMSIIFAVFLAQLSKCFWENKSKFVVQKKNREKKTKSDKNIWVWNLKKAKKGQFWAILKISFSPWFAQVFEGNFFLSFLFFFEKIILVSSSLRLLIKYFCYLKKVLQVSLWVFMRSTK